MRVRAIVSAVMVLVFSSGNPLDGSQPLNVQVTPRIAPAPGWVRVSARVEPSEDSRVLEISATSSEFERRSYVPLDGASAPRLSVIDYVNLPSGTYEVSVVLIGNRGRRASASQFVQVVPMPGQR